MNHSALPISPRAVRFHPYRSAFSILTFALMCAASFVMTLPAAASETQNKGFFRKMSDPPLPPELTTEVDVFQVAKVRSTRNPLTFKPYRVSKLKRGWMRSRSEMGGVAVDRSSVAGYGRMRSRQNYAFTMNESDVAQWSVGCSWEASKGSILWAGRKTSVESPTSGAIHLQCDIGKPEDSPLWGLVMTTDHDGLRGLAGTTKAAGELLGPVNTYTIRLFYVVEGSRVLGDIPAGYLFLDGETPVAAMTMSGWSYPLRFTVSRSVDADDRSVIAAAAAALALQEEMPDFDE